MALRQIDEPTRVRFSALLADTADHAQQQQPRDERQRWTRPTPDASVQRSQTAWLEVRDHLIEKGIGLAARAAELYDPSMRLGGAPALSIPAWLPTAPIPLGDVVLALEPDAEPARITGTEAEARPTLPLRAPGLAFERYSSAIRYLRPPSLFENRHSYRLVDVDAGERLTLAFSLSTFFDKLDVGEALAHEAAAADRAGHLDWSSLPFRSLVTDPFDLSRRAVNPGITTLTIRHNITDGSGTFPLLRRNPTKVTNGRHYSLLPAGEFQPASISPASVATDLDLWRNIVREYSEEALGRPEHDGSTGVPVDYDGWRFYREMSQARQTGDVRVYLLGIVLDALSLNATILTAAVIDDRTFDRLFRDLVTTNPEGDVIFALGDDNRRTLQGVPFDHAAVDQLVHREPLGQTSAACLTLAWRHRDTLIPMPSAVP